MDARNETELARMKSRMTVERKSERELVISRTFNAPARLVFEAWSTPELFKQWWVPKSMPMSLRACEMDIRTGGKYRLVFGDETTVFMEVFGKYLEVTPPLRIVWTNEEADEGGAVTTVTFEEKAGETVLVIHELYPSKKALEDALASGSTEGYPEQLEQLQEFLTTRVANLGRA